MAKNNEEVIENREPEPKPQENTFNQENPYAKFKVDLGETEREDLEKLFSGLIRDYYERAMPQRFEMIRDGRDRYDQVVEPLDYPFEDAPNQKTAIVPLGIRGIKTKLTRIFFRIESIAIASTEKKELLELLIKNENAANYVLRKKIKVQEKLPDAVFNSLEDGTGIVETFLDRRTKRVKKNIKYNNIAKFHSDFPSAQSANISEDKYAKLVKDITAGKEVKVPRLADKLIYFDANVRIIEREDFILLPAESIDIESAKGCGKQFKRCDDNIKEDVERGIYDDVRDKNDNKKQRWESIEAIGDFETQEEQQQNERIGINKTDENQQKTDTKKEQAGYVKEHLMVELIWKNKHGNDQYPRDYWYTMAISTDYGSCSIVQCIEDPNEHGERKYASLIFDKRKSKQFDGVSVPEMVRHNDDVGQRALNLLLQFHEVKMKPPIKMQRTTDEDETDEYKLGLSEFWFMDDPDKNAIPIDLGGATPPQSMAIIEYEERAAELILGVGPHASGGESAADPSAPASKTAMLIREGNERVLEGADTMRPGINKVYRQCMSIHYQIQDRNAEGKFNMDFVKEKDRKGRDVFDTISSDEIDVDHINIEVDFESATQSMNRQIEKEEFLEFIRLMFETKPEIAQDPFVQGAIIEHYMDIYNSKLRQKIDFSPEAIKERQAAIMARALELKEEQEAENDADLENKANQSIREDLETAQAEGLSEEEGIDRATKTLMATKNRMDEQRQSGVQDVRQ